MIKLNSRILAIGFALVWLDSHLIGGDIGDPPPNVKLMRITDETILPQRDKPFSKKQRFMRFIWEIQEKEKTFGYVAVQLNFHQARREWSVGVYEYDPIQKQKKLRGNRIPWLPERGRFPADALNYAVGYSIQVFGADHPQERDRIASLHGRLDLWREVWLDFLKAVRETLRDGPPEEEREQPCGVINTNLWDFEAARWIYRVCKQEGRAALLKHGLGEVLYQGYMDVGRLSSFGSETKDFRHVPPEKTWNEISNLPGLGNFNDPSFSLTLCSCHSEFLHLIDWDKKRID